MKAWGADTSRDKEQAGEMAWNREASGEDWKEIDEFLRQELGDTDKPFLFTDLVGELAEGGGKHIGGVLLSMVKRFLFQEVAHSGRMVGELLVLGLIGAIFSGFSHIFAGGQISETAFFMTYLLAFTVLMTAFADSVAITREILAKQTEFMKILLPSYFLAVAWVGGSASAIGWMELVLFLIAAVQWLYLNLLLPLTRVYILLVMAGNMVREELLTKLTSLLQSAVRWGIRSLAGVVLGFQLIQGTVLPYVDTLQATGTQKLLQLIPGMEAISKTVLGSGVLIKNTIGAAAVAVLVGLSLVPLIKLLIMLLLYQAAAAVLQPLGDKRLVACINSMAEGQKMLLEIAAFALALFAITIALVCAGTNVSYLL